MATIINNPRESENSGIGLILGILVALAVIVLFFLYGLPALRNDTAPAETTGASIDVNLPAGNNNGGNQ